ncbi:VOC family protein [Xanthobacter sp. V4C-4]|uniref:VOC family protein n=1 Tax=Xanthobacter cornucopiae TaxID=3119924 RepID=UPI00372703F9
MSPDVSLRLHLVTLGVADLPRACAFYTAMGLERRDAAAVGVAFEALPVFRGHTLACNVSEAEAVAAVIARAVAAGGRCVKPAQAVFWGGTSGYFADPDGHLWEVAHNPFFPFDGEGRLTVPR